MLSKSLFDPIITPTIAVSFEAIDCRLIRRAIVVKAASIGRDLLISIRQVQSE